MPREVNEDKHPDELLIPVQARLLAEIYERAKGASPEELGELAEALAWLRAPAQPHGGARGARAAAARRR